MRYQPARIRLWLVTGLEQTPTSKTRSLKTQANRREPNAIVVIASVVDPHRLMVVVAPTFRTMKARTKQRTKIKMLVGSENPKIQPTADLAKLIRNLHTSPNAARLSRTGQ